MGQGTRTMRLIFTLLYWRWNEVGVMILAKLATSCVVSVTQVTQTTSFLSDSCQSSIIPKIGKSVVPKFFEEPTLASMLSRASNSFSCMMLVMLRGTSHRSVRLRKSFCNSSYLHR